MIDQFFLWCIGVLEVIGEVTGMGYELANIIIFVILQPGLILLFFILWRFEKKRKVKISNNIKLIYINLKGVKPPETFNRTIDTKIGLVAQE